MIFHLNVPPSQEQQVRRMGALWDSSSKKFYLDCPRSLKPFLQWLSPKVAAKADDYVGPKKPPKRKPKDAAHFGYTTARESYHPPCDCLFVLPWEDCKHSKESPRAAEPASP